MSHQVEQHTGMAANTCTWRASLVFPEESLLACRKVMANLQASPYAACLSSAFASLLRAQPLVWLPAGLPVSFAPAQLAWRPSAVLPSQLSFQRCKLPFSPLPGTPSLGSASWRYGISLTERGIDNITRCDKHKRQGEAPRGGYNLYQQPCVVVKI